MNSHPTFKTSLSRSFLLASLAAGIGLGSTVALAADEAAKPAARSDGLGAALNDSAITTRVKAKLMGESSLKNSDISVTTTNGVVTLEGQASSGEAKSAAESATRAVDGVRSVDNNLKTPSASSAGARTKAAVARTGQAVSDSWITTKVKSEILAGSVKEGFDVSVETIDGVVVLKGRLPDQPALDHVRKMTLQVKGVKSVDSSAVSVGGK